MRKTNTRRKEEQEQRETKRKEETEEKGIETQSFESGIDFECSINRVRDKEKWKRNEIKSVNSKGKVMTTRNDEKGRKRIKEES